MLFEILETNRHSKTNIAKQTYNFFKKFLKPKSQVLIFGLDQNWRKIWVLFNHEFRTCQIEVKIWADLMFWICSINFMAIDFNIMYLCHSLLLIHLNYYFFCLHFDVFQLRLQWEPDKRTKHICAHLCCMHHVKFFKGKMPR